MGMGWVGGKNAGSTKLQVTGLTAAAVPWEHIRVININPLIEGVLEPDVLVLKWTSLPR